MSSADELPAASRGMTVDLRRLPDEAWLPVLQQPCDFGPDIFESVSLNLLKNPNINSSLLFRADILFDSGDELTDEELPVHERQLVLQEYNLHHGELTSFTVCRTLLRRMIPRNPQLDKPILQTCLFLRSTLPTNGEEQNLVLSIPHADSVDAIPWYHPRVQSLAYLHTWSTSSSTNNPTGTVSLHYRLYPPDVPPLSTRLERTAHHLLTTLLKHGTGRLSGYEKRVHHDQLVSQARIQDMYTELKRKHANRLCERWVEKTEPSKHVFEDLGIAAFLIELWRDMYDLSGLGQKNGWTRRGGNTAEEGRPSFPGFVDIGCGNGVLVDILIREGFKGWGFDARKRKTWDTFEPFVRKHLKEAILIPEPLQRHGHAPSISSTNGVVDLDNAITGSTGVKEHKRSILTHLRRSPSPPDPDSYNGVFPTGTFIISNHADELTPWTPLLASLSSSPFLCIPCCSHNLSGERFRAPSTFNDNTADAFAPSYFKNYQTTSKSVPIRVAHSDNDEMYSSEPCTAANNDQQTMQARNQPNGVETGDLKEMAGQRKKQPSAYSSLCDWVGNLAATVGYQVEKEMLRLPSTRNVGLIGRAWQESFEDESLGAKNQRVATIVQQEKADLTAWLARANSLREGAVNEH